MQIKQNKAVFVATFSTENKKSYYPLVLAREQNKRTEVKETVLLTKEELDSLELESKRTFTSDEINEIKLECEEILELDDLENEPILLEDDENELEPIAPASNVDVETQENEPEVACEPVSENLVDSFKKKNTTGGCDGNCEGCKNGCKGEESASKKKKSFKEKIKAILPSKRKLIQLYTALLFNANIKGFVDGNIFKGKTKYACAPGINCYSCPGATLACPLGALQAELNGINKGAGYYVIGILLLYAIMFGRLICGWFCPFGLVQELFFKIKTPKIKKNKVTRVLSYIKYVLLGLLVIVVPILYGIRDVPLPAFCKYICPAGTLEGAFGLLSNKVNESSLSALGPLFTWKFVMFVSITVGCIFMFRFFCRFICPLGAIYGFFNKISVLGIKLDKSKCTNCGLCIKKCKMDINHVGDHECISCGECVGVCPTKAITFKGSKIILPDDEIDTSNLSEEEATALREENDKKNKKKRTIVRIVVASIMTLVLGGALVYFNFIHKEDTLPPLDGDEITDTTVEVGNQIGNRLPSFELDVFDENGFVGKENQTLGGAFGENESGNLTFDPTNNLGKITVINFWGTWCPGCVAELPYFDRIASEYKDRVTVVAVHTDSAFNTASKYVNDNYKDSDIIFVKDQPYNGEVEKYFTMLDGKNNMYPYTVIIDENGVILQKWLRATTYEELKGVIDTELNKEDEKEKPPVGSNIGNSLASFDLVVFDESGKLLANGQDGAYGSNSDGYLTFNPAKNSGKITIINFWGTWCPGCVAELPYFDRIASEYKDDVTVVAVHTDSVFNTASKYVNDNYKDSDIIFVKDEPYNSEVEIYYTYLGGKNNMYPHTVIVDENGVIISSMPRATTYEELKGIVDGELSK